MIAGPGDAPKAIGPDVLAKTEGYSAPPVVAPPVGDENKVAADTMEAKPSRRRLVDTTKRSPELEQIDTHLASNVISQSEVRGAVLRVLERMKVVAPTRGPGGSILVVGPTGVGKTKTFEELAEEIGAKLIEFEGGNFKNKGDVTGLTGASPTFVGHGSTSPAITQPRIEESRGKKLPFTIILLNELDKAHPDVLDWWLKALDSGKNTVWVPKKGDDEGGKTNGAEEHEIDLSRCLIVATANAAADHVLNEARRIEEAVAAKGDAQLLAKAEGVADLRFVLPEEEGFREGIRTAVQKTFQRPEFLGRWDEIPVAWPLRKPGYARILELELQKTRKELERSDQIEALPLRMSPAAKSWLLKQLDPALGARNLSKVVKKYVASELTRAIGAGTIASGDFVVGDVKPDGSGLHFFSRTLETIKAKPWIARTLAQKDVVGADAPGLVEKPAAQEPPRPKMTNARSSEPSKRLSEEDLADRVELSMNRVLPGTRRLNLMETYSQHATSISFATADRLLSNMPRSEGWIYKKPTSSYYKVMVANMGMTEWAVAEEEPVDITTVFRILSKLEGPITEAQAKRLATVAKGVAKESVGFQGKKEVFQSEILAAIDLLCQRAVRAAS